MTKTQIKNASWLLKINILRSRKVQFWPHIELRAGWSAVRVLQRDYAQEPELSVLDDVFIACRQCHALCPSGRDQEAVRRIAVRLAR
jgi:hypothetical protein